MTICKLGVRLMEMPLNWLIGRMAKASLEDRRGARDNESGQSEAK